MGRLRNEFASGASTGINHIITSAPFPNPNVASMVIGTLIWQREP